MVLRCVLGLLGLAGLTVALMAPDHTACAAPAASKGIVWNEGLAKGLALAKKQNKPALVDFYADWCSWCKRLDSDTYTDARVIELSKRFVMIKVNTENDRPTMIKYGVRSLPTIVITDPSGREVNRVTGYRPASSFLDEMQLALRQAKASR
jgi:thiol:disulfide interchange protein